MSRRSPRNTSRIEVIAHKNEIEKLLLRGYNYKIIFNILKDQGKISCKYHAFLKSAKAICIYENDKNVKQLTKKSENSQSTNDERPFREADKSSDDLI